MQPLARAQGMEIIVDVPGVDESIEHDYPPHIVVETLAQRKGQAVAARHNDDALIVAADTIVVFNDEIFEKPRDKAHAHKMLSALSGNTHTVYTGVYCNGQVWHEHALVTFKDIMSLIDWYIDTGESFDKAGGYGVQGLGGAFVEHIGGDVNCVIGLPLSKLEAILSSYADIAESSL